MNTTSQPDPAQPNSLVKKAQKIEEAILARVDKKYGNKLIGGLLRFFYLILFGLLNFFLKLNRYAQIGVAAVVVIAVMSAIFISNIPKTIEIKDESIAFTNWDDVKAFNEKLASFPKLLGISSAADLSNMSEAQATVISKQLQNMNNALVANYKTAGKILPVPIGTDLKITGYYDENGNLTKPVWNDAQKTIYTPEGGFVYVTANWQETGVMVIFQ